MQIHSCRSGPTECSGPDLSIRLPRHRSGIVVDCHPDGCPELPARGIHADCVRLHELYGRPSLQAQDITCYGCLESVGDLECVLQTLVHHLAEHGVIRTHFLQRPFLSAPKNVGAWIQDQRIDLRQLPSQMGMYSLLNRLGLKVRSRVRTVNLPVGPGGAGKMRGSVYKPWNAIRLAKRSVVSAMSFGFGEEWVLARHADSPAADLLVYPWRPFGKVR